MKSKEADAADRCEGKPNDPAASSKPEPMPSAACVTTPSDTSASHEKFPDPNVHVSNPKSDPVNVQLCDESIMKLGAVIRARGGAPFLELRVYADDHLKKNQRQTVLLCCDHGGSYRIADLAVRYGWGTPWDDACQKHLQDIAKHFDADGQPWTIKRFDNEVRIQPKKA